MLTYKHNVVAGVSPVGFSPARSGCSAATVLRFLLRKEIDAYGENSQLNTRTHPTPSSRVQRARATRWSSSLTILCCRVARKIYLYRKEKNDAEHSE